jgi:PAS domain S-box-containing protein
MTQTPDPHHAGPHMHFLSGAGEMKKRIREFDWSGTELGHPVIWPATLKIAVSIMLDCASPVYIAWGSRFIQLYNDAYIPILGEHKHPKALGSTTPETWHEIWNFVGPLFKDVMSFRQTVCRENESIIMFRNGFLEECFFSFSYNPLTDEDGCVRGVLALPWETTTRVINNRRTETVRDLAQRLSNASDMEGIRAAFEKTVLQSERDLTFGLWYERKGSGGLELIASASMPSESDMMPETIMQGSKCCYEELSAITTLTTTEHALNNDAMPWALLLPPEKHTRHVSFFPLCYRSYLRPEGYLVLGQNSMRPNDAAYERFIQEIGNQIENAVRRVQREELQAREIEHHYSTVLAVLPCMVWISDTANNCIFVNKTWLDFTGSSFQESLGHMWIKYVHPEDVAAVLYYQKTRCQLQSTNLEFRMRHVSGEYRWVLNQAIPHFGMTGEFAGYIGICLDITERKNAEEQILASQHELRTLYDRLERVRTEERSHLAREVHDQLGQIMSAAKIDIKLLEEDFKLRTSKFSRHKVLRELRSASHTIDEAIQVIRELTIELRTPELKEGLEAALKWHVRDFERRTRIPCSLRLPSDMCQLTETAATALFRIFQEAMTNILRHGMASRIWICLECNSRNIKLRVMDNGVGISFTSRQSARSVGLRGMRERALLVGGKLVVGQLKQAGTLVTAVLPASAMVTQVGMTPRTHGDAV